MKTGTGAVMLMTLTSTAPQAIEQPEGHATAVYKSRGGSLYFFDPNIGVYEVHDAAAFITSWKETYARELHQTVSMTVLEGPATQDGFYACKPDAAVAAASTAT
jgi:hypothetical protein